MECNQKHYPHKAENTKRFVKLNTLRLGRVPVLLYERGTPDGAPEAAPSPEPVTVLKRVEAALATAPAPAERAAPPAATIPPAFAVAAAPTAAPALKRNKNLNIKIIISKKLRARYQELLT
jgi:hypothetical protein